VVPAALGITDDTAIKLVEQVSKKEPDCCMRLALLNENIKPVVRHTHDVRQDDDDAIESVAQVCHYFLL
jgi:hypothetical protein